MDEAKRRGRPFGPGTKHLVTHGYSKTKIYQIWCGMRDRCGNPNSPAYHNYGGRGIAVCERWGTFENFLADMGEPAAGATLDRIDNNGNYSPDNCRWASRREQSRNNRRNHILTMDGESKPLIEWAEQYGLKHATLWNRIKLGWDVSLAIKTPTIRKRKGIPRGGYAAYAAEHEIELGDERKAA